MPWTLMLSQACDSVEEFKAVMCVLLMIIILRE